MSTEQDRQEFEKWCDEKTPTDWRINNIIPLVVYPLWLSNRNTVNRLKAEIADLTAQRDRFAEAIQGNYKRWLGTTCGIECIFCGRIADRHKSDCIVLETQSLKQESE